MDLPGFKLHLLKGALRILGCYGTVIFHFRDNATDVDYVDYH